VERLGPAAVVADVMTAPAHPEFVAAGCEFTDEAGQCRVVRVAAGLGAQAADGVVGDAVPVAVELGGAGIEEDEPGEIDRPGRGEERRVVQIPALASAKGRVLPEPRRLLGGWCQAP
jgi:hypothetical protein